MAVEIIIPLTQLFGWMPIELQWAIVLATIGIISLLLGYYLGSPLLSVVGYMLCAGAIILILWVMFSAILNSVILSAPNSSIPISIKVT